MGIVTESRVDTSVIQQGIFNESAGHGFSEMVKVGYCRDCGYGVTAEDFVEECRSLAEANATVGGQNEGHAYFNRGHTVNSVYVPFSIHPNPFGGEE
jgi:hypothetical protein